MSAMVSTQPATTIPAAAPSAAGQAAAADKRARIAKTAHDFEASYLSVMLGQMFEGVSSGPLGGQGEAMFKSFLTDAMAKSLAKHGGVGLSKPLQNEMLKMQGLTDPGAHA